MIHHVTIEADRRKLAKEREFWGLLDFHRDFSNTKRNEPEWLMNVHTRCAIHLHLTDDPTVPEFAHVAVVVPDFDRTVRILRSFNHKVDTDVAPYCGSPRAYTAAPTGYPVELIQRVPSVRMGMPKEGNHGW